MTPTSVKFSHVSECWANKITLEPATTIYHTINWLFAKLITKACIPPWLSAVSDFSYICILKYQFDASKLTTRKTNCILQLQQYMQIGIGVQTKYVDDGFQSRIVRIMKYSCMNLCYLRLGLINDFTIFAHYYFYYFVWIHVICHWPKSSISHENCHSRICQE